MRKARNITDIKPIFRVDPLNIWLALRILQLFTNFTSRMFSNFYTKLMLLFIRSFDLIFSGFLSIILLLFIIHWVNIRSSYTADSMEIYLLFVYQILFYLRLKKGIFYY